MGAVFSLPAFFTPFSRTTAPLFSYTFFSSIVLHLSQSVRRLGHYHSDLITLAQTGRNERRLKVAFVAECTLVRARSAVFQRNRRASGLFPDGVVANG